MNPLGKIVLQVNPLDSVAVALRSLTRGEWAANVSAVTNVPMGHKIALRSMQKGEEIVKYGYSIGIATKDIAAGELVHSHNMESSLTGRLESGGFKAYRDEKRIVAARSFDGYRRPDGSVGTRNEIWVINTVGCINHAASRIAERAAKEIVCEGSAVEGIYTFNHCFGCSQLSDDLTHTQLLLAGLAKHPNAAAVLVMGLGCENNQMDLFLKFLGDRMGERVRYFNAQQVVDELDTGVSLVHELAEYAGQFKREPVPASELVLGMKCGGSDGLSGITANPLVGEVADRLAAQGGTSILSEVPEMFGAEKVLLKRACNAVVYDSTVELVNETREYFRRYDEPIDKNPSPGNREGGITTLAEKSLGCVQKGGTSQITQVLAYGDRVTPGTAGIALLSGPGNDGVSGSVLSAAGAHVVLFTTGRGTPMGFPVPTLKISTNTPLIQRKPGWIDFSAGPLADGSATMKELADQLFELVIDVSSGRKQTKSEINGYREIAIWKDGVTL